MNKILFIGGYPNTEEPVRNVFFQKLVWEIANQGIECCVIAPVPIRGKTSLGIKNESIETTNKGLKIRVYRPKYFSYSSRNIFGFNTLILSELAFRKAAKRQARKIDFDFDAIYGHFILRGGLAATDLAMKYSVPAFFACGESDLNNDVFRGYPFSMAKRISECKGVISVSSKNKEDLIKYGLFNDDDIIVAPNSVDTSIFRIKSKIESRKDLGFPKDAFIVGFAGYFIDRKGDKRLLKAANNLPVKLAFAGKGDNPPIGDNVIFCGQLNHEKMPIFSSACDIFVLPTLAEGCCNSIVEAMSCGLPIVSSNLPFNDDILNDGNSIRVDPNNVDEIRHAIERLYKDENLRLQLSKGSIETAKALSIDKRAEVIISFIAKKITDNHYVHEGKKL